VKFVILSAIRVKASSTFNHQPSTNNLFWYWPLLDSAILIFICFGFYDTFAMTDNEKIFASALAALFEKTINLEDNQAALMRIVSGSLPLDAEQKKFLLTAVARVESASDQTRACLEELKALIKPT
jgi:hypothetical protein